MSIVSFVPIVAKKSSMSILTAVAVLATLPFGRVVSTRRFVTLVVLFGIVRRCAKRARLRSMSLVTLIPLFLIGRL